jgi:hypothetical protein
VMAGWRDAFDSRQGPERGRRSSGSQRARPGAKW